jgi:hypothetical protein
MMFGSLSDRERRLLAIAILLGLLLLVVRGLVLPVVAGFSERAEARALLEMEFARNARLVQSSGRLARAAARQTFELRAFMLTAPSTAAGEELLQERLQTDIEAAGGEFRLAELVPGGPDQLRARVDARLTLAQLSVLLAALQNRPPYMAVEGLTIAADAALISSTPGPLDVRFDVSVPFLAAAA